MATNKPDGGDSVFSFRHLPGALDVGQQRMLAQAIATIL